MAMKHFLKVYPLPKNPSTYTGLFKKRWETRPWSDKPNKSLNGVSWTKYADAMCISVGRGVSLFDFIHGECGWFADYFHEQNPDWNVVDMMRGNFWNSLIHSYCIKQIDGRTYFADARGITDDPEEFFSDFTCSKNMYVVDHEPDESLHNAHPKFVEKIAKAYNKMYSKGIAIL